MTEGRFLAMITHQLRSCAEQGNVKKLDSLLESYSWLLKEKEELSRALQDAVTREHMNVIDYLCGERGVPVDIACGEGKTALHAASKGNKFDIMKNLVARGAALNLQDNRGNTPLHYAVNMGSCTATDILIDLGADAGIRNKNGYSPLDIARAKRYIGLERGMITRIAKRHECRLKRRYIQNRPRP